MKTQILANSPSRIYRGSTLKMKVMMAKRKISLLHLQRRQHNRIKNGINFRLNNLNLSKAKIKNMLTLAPILKFKTKICKISQKLLYNKSDSIIQATKIFLMNFLTKIKILHQKHNLQIINRSHKSIRHSNK